jgi:hypothetical protein
MRLSQHSCSRQPSSASSCSDASERHRGSISCPVLLVLDPLRQQLDADSARPRIRRRQDCTARLVAITKGPIVRLRWPHMLLAAFLTTGHERHCHGRVAHAARPARGGSAGDVALGIGARCRAHPSANAVRPSHSRVRSALPFGLMSQKGRSFGFRQPM